MRKTLTVLGAIALVMLITTGAFAAKGLITGKQIKDGSITGKDIKDASITGKDIKNRSVPVVKLSGRLPAGPAGPVGPAGPGGAVGPNDKFVSLDILNASGSAVFTGGFGANAGLKFLDGVNNTASFHIVLPPGYTPNTPVAGTFTWHTPATSCAVRWRSNYTSVSRPGQIHVIGPSTSSGMSDLVPSTSGSAANVVQSATFTLTSPLAPFTLQPGDSYTFGLYRNGDTAADTCAAAAFIDSMVIRYQ